MTHGCGLTTTMTNRSRLSLSARLLRRFYQSFAFTLHYCRTKQERDKDRERYRERPSFNHFRCARDTLCIRVATYLHQNNHSRCNAACSHGRSKKKTIEDVHRQRLLMHCQVSPLLVAHTHREHNTSPIQPSTEHLIDKQTRTHTTHNTRRSEETPNFGINSISIAFQHPRKCIHAESQSVNPLDSAYCVCVCDRRGLPQRHAMCHCACRM